jgi:tungstate transport system substrate-binding protein
VSLKRLALLVLALALAGCTSAQPKGEMILATTTSTQDSGLLDLLIPAFEQQSGYKVKVIAVGSGQALAMGEKGEADALLSHAASAEQKLVDAGVVKRYSLVMHNDFVLLGPPDDPCRVESAKTTEQALQLIATNRCSFVSRGDDSGTHKKEQELWAAAKLDRNGPWVVKSGSGMGQTLTIASEKKAYTLSDRATYLAQKQNLSLKVLFQSDPALLNIYHVMQVNPEKFPKVKAAAGQAFVDFMLKRETQERIAKFGVDKYGEALFFADAMGKQ